MVLLKVLESYYKMLEKKIKALDCTLTNDGYSNDRNFGKQIVSSYLVSPSKAIIDIIQSIEGLKNL